LVGKLGKNQGSTFWPTIPKTWRKPILTTSINYGDKMKFKNKIIGKKNFR
jgi:hypothetical protein